MLKTIQNHNVLNRDISTICAEIHYITSKFTIVCFICNESCNEYHEFMNHFQNKHLEEFLQKLQITDFHSKRNPIKSLVKTQILQKPEEIPVKQEKIEVVSQKRDQWLNQPLIDEQLPEECEDINCDELLYCKIEKEQETDNLDYTLENPFTPLELEDAESITNNEPEEMCSDVDWSRSYAPTNLKLNQKRPYKPRNQPNACSYCGKTFRRRYQLDTHLNIHTGLKPHQCDVCGRQFRAITTLQRHLNTHDKRQTFICRYCSKEFSHRAALVSHETRHTQERCVPCEDCDKLFYTQNQLDTHKRKLHNKLDDNSLPFACDLCAKRYRSASMLSTHKFKKHYKTAKYICEQCDKKFVDQHQLTIHMNIHIKKL